jgi:hypothetical protein
VDPNPSLEGVLGERAERYRTMLRDLGIARPD